MLLQQVDEGLIVSVLDTLLVVLKPFLQVLFLFSLEHVDYVQLLQLFVCVVYAQLFQAVHREVLETEDVQQSQTDQLLLLLLLQRNILIIRIRRPAFFRRVDARV